MVFGFLWLTGQNEGGCQYASFGYLRKELLKERKDDMRRKSDKDIIKEYRILVILGVVCVLFGLSAVLLPALIPITPYEEYMEKEVVILEFDHYYVVKGSSYDYIITEDGKYNITGKYSRSQLSDILTEGTVAMIKYDINPVFPHKKYVEEMSIAGNKVVTYDDDEPIQWTGLIIFCLVFCLIGVGLLFVCRRVVIQNRKLQVKRDEKIIKKYGKLKK